MRNPAKMRRIALPLLLASSIAAAPVTGQADALGLSDAPLFISTSVEPNVMLLIDDSGSMASTVKGTKKTRMEIAREVATNLVNNTSGMRFGLAAFNSSEGGRILADCGSSKKTVTDAIANLTAASWTPLAESMYEVTRYFRGLSSHYNKNTTYTSPVQYRCQKNFTIVITDGLPTYDTSFPSNDPDDPSGKLPNWDGIATATDDDDAVFPKHSDGFQPSGSEGDEGYSLYLDDIAKFAYDVDMKTSGKDAAGKSYQDPKYPKQNINTYTIGFTVANQMLEDAAAYGNGKYFTANDAASLTAALNDAIEDIRAMSSSAAAVATNSTSLNTGGQVYIAKFNSEFWSGTLLSAPITSAGVIGKPTWNSDTLLATPTATDRVIVTYKPSSSKGIPFRWPADVSKPGASELDSVQTTALVGADVLSYLRGDATNEGSASGKFRSRPNTKLGDIINSSPQYVGKPVGQYDNENIFRQAYETAGYLAFRNAKLNRTPMVYVGANDGMLHGFNASTSDADKGKELLAYVPNQVFSNLKNLSDQNYTHKYYVDGSPTVADAQIGDDWKTVLVGGLNKGGKGIYALDVTDPAMFTEAKAGSIVMWEFTDADLGFTFSKPMIVKTNAGWAAVFGNGYNNTIATNDAKAVSTTGYAVLYIVNLSNGSLIKKISTEAGSNSTPNGLASVNGIDMDGNGTVDYIYGGDLLGNMWKFDISKGNANDWKVAYDGAKGKPDPLYQANDSDGNPQPITNRPEVSFHPADTDTVMVYFGTGKYLGDADKTSTQTQTFYAIWDKGARVSTVTTRNSGPLLRQTLTTSVSGGKNYRNVTDSKVDWKTHKGWYQDLSISRERTVGTPMLLKGILIYSTFIPNTDPCLSGGTGYLMTVDFQNGGLPDYPALDTNGADAGFGDTLVGGVEMDVGSGGSNVIGGDGKMPIALSPAAACDPADVTCVACVEDDTRPHCPQKINPKSIPGLRISWRELINK